MPKPLHATCRIITVTSLTIIVAALATACINTAAPKQTSELVFIIGEAPRIPVVDGIARQVVGQIGVVPVYKSGVALSPDGSIGVVAGVDHPPQEGYLVFFDTRTLAITARLPITSAVASHPIDNLWIGGSAFAFSPDGTKLFSANAFRMDPNHATGTDTSFVGVLDARTHHVLGVAGPLIADEGWGLATLPPGPAAPAGAVLAIGTRLGRNQQGQTIDRLFVIDPATFAIIDSATIDQPAQASGNFLLTQLIAAPDGSAAYLMSADHMLYKYDLVRRQVVARAPAAAGGLIAIAPDGQTLYLTDPGSLDFGSSGQLFVYGPNLERRTPIDLRPAFGGPPATFAAALSQDGQRLYVAASYLKHYLLIINPAAGIVTDTVPVASVGALLVREPRP